MPAEAAARADAVATIEGLRTHLERRDRGRQLRSYRLALLTVDAADAFGRGDFAAAARLARAARAGMFFARSLNTIALLEADALAAAGRPVEADSLRRVIAAGASSMAMETRSP